ncbi:separin protein [Friedmanniomyces endolithicus]|uniref:separase n=1 Tax=Friedmanniomyces endolithicus TaxID=329885 RepID=A0AAN6F8R5_9PEZI|nr:separin protein [Friedmanniomyces endolithicus]
MAVLLPQVDMVKADLASGSASTATVSALQHFLTAERTPKPAASSVKPNPRLASKSTTSKASSSNPRKASVPQPTQVHEDATETLSPKTVYALATEVVNITLKVLTSTAKSRTNDPTFAQSNVSASAPVATTTPASRQASDQSTGPLESRSGNSTPVRLTTDSKKGLRPSACRSSPAPDLVPTAECARLAFAYLRSAPAQKLSPRSQSRWQLETGMLVFSSRLVALGLDGLAVKELRILKRRLQPSRMGNEDADQSLKTTKTSTLHDLERETLASLIRFKDSFDGDPEVLGLAISHQLLVLKIIASSRKPAVIEALLEQLKIDQPGSPASLMIQQAATAGGSVKSAKQLEVLAQSILSLCPSVSAGFDATAMSSLLSPCPQAVFELQVLALRLRQAWWKLTDHRSNPTQELVEPFSKMIAAFKRRAEDSCKDAHTYDMVDDSHKLLNISSVPCSAEVRLEILASLASLAEGCGRIVEASLWTERMVTACDSLEPRHARRTACLVKRYAFASSKQSNRDGNNQTASDCSAIIERLREQPTGHTTDYDFLLCELVRVTQLQRIQHDADFSTIIHLAAGFAQRYARSYPDRNACSVLAVIQAAIRQSNTADEMQKWVTQDAVRVYIQSGTLATVAGGAARMSMSEAWLLSTDAIALDRILQALVLRSLRHTISDAAIAPVDDEILPSGQRGVLLEKQLCHALNLTGRSKYRAALQKLIPDILSRLARLTATIAFCLRESHPELLPPHAVRVWCDESKIAEGVHGEDAGLACFLRDIVAGWTVARAFYDRRPTVASLEPSLLAWQHLVDSSSSRLALCEQLYDTETTATQLEAIAMYLSVMGSDRNRLRVLSLQLRLARLSGRGADHECVCAIAVSRQYLDMGFSEKAGVLLAGCRAAASHSEHSTLTRLQLSVAFAEYYAAIDECESAHVELEQARELRTTVQPESVPRHERKAYELLHARAWLVHSRLAIKSGRAADALVAAKRAVKLLNATWAALEHAVEGRDSGSLALTNLPDASEADIKALSTGVSKLQLAPIELPGSKASAVGANKGAGFWAIVPLACRAMMHLSDMYVHHGLFAEADYYSERAVTIAESIQSKTLLARLQSHRCRLMVIADRLEDAELCLTRRDEAGLEELSIATVEHYGAKATLRMKEESFEDGLQALRQAAEVIDRLRAESLMLASQCYHDVNADQSVEIQNRALCTVEVAEVNAKDSGAVRRRRQQPATTTKVKAASKGRTKPKNAALASGRSARPSASQHYLLDKIQAELLVECGIADLRVGRDVDATAVSISPLAPAVRKRHLNYRIVMRKVAQALMSDVSYNSLSESTISFPALLDTESSVSTTSNNSLIRTSHAPPKKTSATSKVTARECGSSDERIDTLLLQARNCFIMTGIASLGVRSIAQLHFESTAMLSATMFLSALGTVQTQSALHPLEGALRLELPRITAVQCESTIVKEDKKLPEAPSPFTWPKFEQPAAPAAPAALSAQSFQQQYVDTLPVTWTAVSLCLNDDCSELYVARYRSGQSPLILRLPFSRHKPEGDDEEAFDYHAGKAELQDIIQVSNYSCHNSGAVEGKGAKSNWWAEREALDRRLHELLVNIENIWFGGFKAVLSQQARRPDLLVRFRKSLDDILKRYLPSRQSSKGRDNPFALDDKVLELFIGLGSDQDGMVDLDEPLADLLYFVVDMLQFAGERNAYDEIDFDGMAVDVLDALRSYHEACIGQCQDTGHLILVLDKRLQAFPWESLPYLQGSSVSRVNSMLGLRERILAMRRRQSSPSNARYTVSRTSGTYILNPSGDLTSTQTMLSPPLESLDQVPGSSWTSVVKREPNEEEFRTALTDCSMLLYFGHGAGSQYIRPRSIKKLDSCSEVVWLMGCSSGAVTEYGELGPSAVPFAYLMAGGFNSDAEMALEDTEIQATRESKCMAVVATLWDVTDKDIDRFSLAMGEEWGLWPASEASKLPAKTPRKRERIAAPSTPPQAPKTPKTRKGPKTPAPAAKTPARSRNRGEPGRDAGKKHSLAEAVAKSRDACYLRYLNGAAPVVYGVPVYLDD